MKRNRQMIVLPTFRILPVLAAVGIAQASAVTIASYTFDANDLTSNDTELNSTAADISSGAGITDGTDLSFGQGAGGTRGIRILYSDIYPENDGDKTLADAINDNIYYSFTVTPEAGQTIDFDRFTAYTDKNSGGAEFTYHIFSSVDGFTTSDSIDSSSHGSGTANLDYDVSSLSGVTSSVEFRLYIRTNNFTTGTNDFDLDNVTLTGTVVPEPSTAAIVALASLSLLRRRR